MSADTSLRKSAMLLAAASSVEYGLQLAMPVVLVRCLDPDAFGQYRMLWLMASTALALAPAFMPQALFYFLPRAKPGAQRMLIGNVLIFLVLVSLLAGLAASLSNPFLPAMPSELFSRTGGLSALFVGIWVMASLLDVLPTADGRASWQAGATVGLAILRILSLAGAAWLTADIVWVVAAMLGVAAAKLGLLCWYVLRRRDRGGPAWEFATLRRQLFYSLPFAAGNGLFLLRGQADEWIVSMMVETASYAAFSIAAVVFPIATLLRQPVYHAMMPHLNRAHQRGDRGEIVRLIARSNGATSLLLLPVAGGLLAAAPELVEIVYTRRYLETIPVMQIYLLGMMVNAWAVGHVLPAIDKGRVAAANSAGCLLLSVPLCFLAVSHVGLAGAAASSMLCFALGEIVALAVVARTLNRRIRDLLEWSALRPTLLATGAAAASAILMTIGMRGAPIYLLLAKGVIYMAVFATCFFLAGGRRHLGLLLRKTG